MKHKTLFRLSLRLLGLVLLGFGIPQFITALVGIFSMLFGTFGTGASSFSMPFQWSTIGWALGPLFQLVFAAYLLIGGEWIVNRFIPSNRPYCPDCGYDVSGSSVEQCPECGSLLPMNVQNLIKN